MLAPLTRFIPISINAFDTVYLFYRTTSAGRKNFETRDPVEHSFLAVLLVQFHKLAVAAKLKLSVHCTHLMGAGEVKRALTEIDTALSSGEFTHVCCWDAKSYYASIRHDILLQLLAKMPLPAGLQKWMGAFTSAPCTTAGCMHSSASGAAASALPSNGSHTFSCHVGMSKNNTNCYI